VRIYNREVCTETSGAETAAPICPGAHMSRRPIGGAQTAAPICPAP